MLYIKKDNKSHKSNMVDREELYRYFPELKRQKLNTAVHGPRLRDQSFQPPRHNFGDNGRYPQPPQSVGGKRPRDNEDNSGSFQDRFDKALKKDKQDESDLSRQEMINAGFRGMGLIKSLKPSHTKMDRLSDIRAKLVQASHIMDENGIKAAEQYLKHHKLEKYKIDAELSTKEGLVVHGPGGAEIAWRGTQPTNWEDWKTNAAVAAGVEDSAPRMERAVELYDAAKAKYGTVEHVSGFSLGGKTALHVGQLRETPITAYNPHLGFADLAKVKPSKPSTIWRIATDIPSTPLAMSKIGENVQVNSLPSIDPSLNPVQSHRLENFSARPLEASAHQLAKAAADHENYAVKVKQLEHLRSAADAVKAGKSFTEWSALEGDKMGSRVRRVGHPLVESWHRAGGDYTHSEAMGLTREGTIKDIKVPEPKAPAAVHDALLDNPNFDSGFAFEEIRGYQPEIGAPRVAHQVPPTLAELNTGFRIQEPPRPPGRPIKPQQGKPRNYGDHNDLLEEPPVVARPVDKRLTQSMRSEDILKLAQEHLWDVHAEMNSSGTPMVDGVGIGDRIPPTMMGVDGIFVGVDYVKKAFDGISNENAKRPITIEDLPVREPVPAPVEEPELDNFRRKLDKKFDAADSEFGLTKAENEAFIRADDQFRDRMQAEISDKFHESSNVLDEHFSNVAEIHPTFKSKMVEGLNLQNLGTGAVAGWLGKKAINALDPDHNLGEFGDTAIEGALSGGIGAGAMSALGGASAIGFLPEVALGAAAYLTQDYADKGIRWFEEQVGIGKDSEFENATATIGSAAAAGALAGSFIPGFGTLAGGGLGALVGGASYLFNKLF